MRSDTRNRPGRLALLSAALISLVLAAGATIAGAQGSVAAQDSIRRSVGTLRPGDVLKISVYRDQELSKDYLIDSRGYVQIPGLGVIQAAGLDPTQVTDRLRDALIARGFDKPEIAVQPLVRVSVLGEIARPGIHPVDPGTSLLQLVTIAGGPTERANLRRTRVVRDGRAFTVDLESALGGSASGRVVLYSNDVIVVPKRSAFFTQQNLGFILSATSVIIGALNFYFAATR